MERKTKIILSVILSIILAIVLFYVFMLFKSVYCSGFISPGISPVITPQEECAYSHPDNCILCMGQGGQEVRFETGGQRKVLCTIKTNETANYEISLVNMVSLKGESSAMANKWVLVKDWKGEVNAGKTKTADFLLLSIPRDVKPTALRLQIIAKNLDDDTTTTMTSTIEIIRTPFIKRIFQSLC